MWRRPAPSSLTRTAARWGWLFARHWSHSWWGGYSDWAGDGIWCTRAKRRQPSHSMWFQKENQENSVVSKGASSQAGCHQFYQISPWCKLRTKPILFNIVVFTAAKDQNWRTMLRSGSLWFCDVAIRFLLQSLLVMPGCKLEVWDKGDGQEQVLFSRKKDLILVWMERALTRIT